jgi:hypothetical protein
MATQNYPALDGFLYNPRLVYAPGFALPLLREQLMDLSTYKFQPKTYATDYSVAIPPGVTSRAQFRIIPGSHIAGLRFTTLNAFPASSMSYLLEDASAQDSEGFGGFVDGQNLYLSCASAVPSGQSGATVCWFAKPYQVRGGVITVQLSNNSTSTACQCQMALTVLEPVQTETTAEYGSILVPPAGKVN